MQTIVFFSSFSFLFYPSSSIQIRNDKFTICWGIHDEKSISIFRGYQDTVFPRLIEFLYRFVFLNFE